nr:MAG TPA_asm: hypothetical protein [Caudoviricetes sp.]
MLSPPQGNYTTAFRRAECLHCYLLSCLLGRQRPGNWPACRRAVAMGNIIAGG